MKKLLCLILAVVMLFALAACGRSGNEDGKKTNRGEFATKPTVTEPAPGDPTMEPSTELPTEPTTPPAVENALAGSWSSKVVVDAEKMEMENVDASMECFINMELNDGMTMEELCAQMAEEIDIDEIMAEYQELLPVSGTYRVEGNMLYITQTDGEGSVEEIAFSYELVDGKLHITSNDEEVQEFFELIGGTDLEFTAN